MQGWGDATWDYGGGGAYSVGGAYSGGPWWGHWWGYMSMEWRLKNRKKRQRVGIWRERFKG